MAHQATEQCEEGPPPLALSVQSHVVFGHVGNAAATLPLQMKGVEVLPLNVLQLSNHLGYGRAKGYRATVAQIADLLEGLKEQGALGRLDMVLTGYLGNAEVIALVSRTIEVENERRRREGRRGLLILCDPVCGDDGRLYVSDTVPEAYMGRPVSPKLAANSDSTSGATSTANSLLHGAEIATPNGFEAALLAGMLNEGSDKVETLPLSTVEQAEEAARRIHRDFGVRHLVITSFEEEAYPNTITMLVSSSTDVTSSGRETRFDQSSEERTTTERPLFTTIRIPQIPSSRFSGTGDAFAACLLGEWWNDAVRRAHQQDMQTENSGTDLHQAFVRCVRSATASLQSVLRATVSRGVCLSLAESKQMAAVDEVASQAPRPLRELALVPCVSSLKCPPPLEEA